MKRGLIKAVRLAKKYSFPVCVFTLACTIAAGCVWLREGKHAASETYSVSAPVEAEHEKEEIFILLPCKGSVMRPFSGDVCVYASGTGIYETHEGVDFAFSGDGEVFAAADGRVTEVKEDRFYGLTVVIGHPNGDESVYASLKEASVRKGAYVRAGDIVGIQGDSGAAERWMGAHLHFEYRSGGKSVQPPFALSENP